jgi:hypothetical protein
MKKINSKVPEEQKQNFKEDTDLLNKFVKFSLEANDKTFIEIFGKDRGSKIYHNDYVAEHRKNLNSFLQSIDPLDKHLVYYHIIYKY